MLKVFVTTFFLFFIASTLYGQSHFRRGNPTPRYAPDEFYIVDSDDDSTFRPTYSFVDTSYVRGVKFPWHEVTGWSNADDASVYMPLAYDSAYMSFFGNPTWFLSPPRVDVFTDQSGSHSVNVPGTSICTNGTICLQGRDSSAQNVPMESAGTMLVAPLWADWELISNSSSNPSKIYVRPAPDTYLISYYNLGLKGTNGAIRATFQVVANATDSSITFEYRSFDGSLNGVSAASIIQKTATIGLSNSPSSMSATYLHRGFYSATNPNSAYAKSLHNGLAVKFFHRQQEAFVIANISMPPKDHYEFDPSASSFQPACSVANYTDSTIDYSVKLLIVDVATGSTVYTKIDTFQSSSNTTQTYTAPSTGSIHCGNYKLIISMTYRTGKNDAWGDNNTFTRYFSVLNKTTAPMREEFDDGISTCYWTNVGATLVDASSAFITPAPTLSTGTGAKAVVMNRLDANGGEYELTQTGGDTLVSCPINLGTSSNVVLSFHYQRGLVTDSTKAGVLNRYRSGPEMEVRGAGGGLPTPGDTLIVEGLLKTGSALNPSDNSWSVLAMIPGGFDLNTQTFITRLNSNFLSDHFRLRFRVKAYNSASTVNYFEDPDNFAIDGIHVEPFVIGKTELEPIDVDLGNGSYTHVPRDLSMGLTPKIRLMNRGDGVSLGTGNLHLIILDALGRWVYDKSRTFDFSYPTRDSIFYMAPWDTHGTQGGTMTAIVKLEGLSFDTYSKNDTNIFYKTLYIDDAYAIDDGTMDTTGTKTLGPTEFYWHFTPISDDTMRNVLMYYPASGGTANWSLTVTGGGQNTSRGLGYTPTGKGWFYSTSTFQKLPLKKDTAYTFYFKLNSGPTEAGDASKGLAYYTLVDSSNSASNQFGVLHPEILSNFYYLGGTLPYTTPYKADVDNGGFLLPMVRPVFSGSQTYLPVEIASLSASRQGDRSVRVAWKTAAEINASRFDVYRGASLVGSASAVNSLSGGDYSLVDRSNTDFGARYNLFEADRDNSYRQIGSVEIGPIFGGQFIVSHYPNPVSNTLKVETSEPMTVLELVDDLGRTVRELNPNNTKVELDLTGVPSGAYTLWAVSDSHRETIKITVSH